MKIAQLVPFLLAPIIAQGYETDTKPKPQAVISQPGEDKPQSPSTKIDISNFVQGIRDYFTLPDLTPEQSKALDGAEGFLKKYIGKDRNGKNKKLNYASIPPLVKGLQQDYDAAHKEADKMGLLKGIAARIYPYNVIPGNYQRVQKEIERRATAEIIEGLQELGVDPKTRYEVDDSPIYVYVTRAELEKFRDNMHIIRDIPARLPPNKKPVFPEGLAVEDLQSIRSRAAWLPPNANLVDINPNEKKVAQLAQLTSKDDKLIIVTVFDKLIKDVDSSLGSGINLMGKVGRRFLPL